MYKFLIYKYCTYNIGIIRRAPTNLHKISFFIERGYTKHIYLIIVFWVKNYKQIINIIFTVGYLFEFYYNIRQVAVFR